MKIIVRASGERTENECIRLVNQQGDAEVIRAYPFGESIKQTYLRAIEIDQEWITVIDADVLLFPGVIEKAIQFLSKTPEKKKIFCFDGRTKDKIFCMSRRAGIHIYRTEHLKQALKFIDNNHIKPETNIRRKIAVLGFKTHTDSIVFGRHDYEQYYKDLWRKSVCQVYKLYKMIERRRMVKRWERLAREDKDFYVIYEAHKYGQSVGKVIIDARKDYGAIEGLKKIEIIEKGEL